MTFVHIGRSVVAPTQQAARFSWAAPAVANTRQLPVVHVWSKVAAEIVLNVGSEEN